MYAIRSYYGEKYMTNNFTFSAGNTTFKIKKLYPSIKVIALTMHDDISIITKMVKAGASGYILKRTNMNEVIDALRIVNSNGRYLSNNAP